MAESTSVPDTPPHRWVPFAGTEPSSDGRQDRHDRQDRQATLLIHGCSELVTVLPYLIGHHPRESLVAVVIDGGHQVRYTFRIDLARLRTAPRAWQALAAYIADQTAGPGAGGAVGGVDGLDGGYAVVLVVYGETGEVADGLPDWTVVSHGAVALAETGTALADALYVASGRWWAYLCDDPECCPAEGTPLPPAVAAGPRSLATAAKRAGLTAFPDRDCLLASLAPVRGRGGRRIRVLVHRAEADFVAAVVAAGDLVRWREAARVGVRQARFRACQPGRGVRWISDGETAALLVALTDPEVRDYCWLQVESDPDDGWLRLWRYLARRAPRHYAADPLFLLAWTAWRRGDGVLARAAVERALDDDPGHVASGMLADALARGLDPRAVPSLEAPAGSGDRDLPAGPADPPAAGRSW